MVDNKILYKNDKVQMKLSGKYYDVGVIKGAEVVTRDSIPFNYKNSISTPKAYKVEYFINLPGLILPEFLRGSAVRDEDSLKLRIVPLDELPLQYPKQKSPYTIIEPLRLSDFMDWQYRAAETLTETTQKVNEILTDETIIDLKRTIANVNALSARSSVTLDKVDTLLDSSKQDIEQLLAMTQQATEDFGKLSANVNNIIGDKQFKKTLLSTADSVDKLSQNLNKIMDAADAEQTGKTLRLFQKTLLKSVKA